jgi:hypothetical protein
MQAMLRLLNEWDPIVYADLHVTDGAEFEHDISINVAPTLVGDAGVVQAAITLRDAMMSDLKSKGSLPVDFYPSLIRDDEPVSGFAVNVPTPRFSHGVWSLRNRIGVLVETHSWKDYKTRVRGTYYSIVEMTRQIAQHGGEWQAAINQADEEAKRIGGTNFALSYDNTEHFKTIDFRGYRYTRQPSSISGALMTHYDNKHPEIWRIPLYDEVKPTLTVIAPRGGYIVPAAWAQRVADKLLIHGIEFQRIDTPSSKVPVQTFRATSTKLSTTTNEGHTTLAVQGQWRDEPRDVPVGSLFIPITQSRSPLVLTMLEPFSGDSLLAWGFFNTAFERKEYMEAYVAEEVAQQMLSKDAALKAEFERKLKEDAEFAKNPEARLDFFYRRHPSWDERFNLYPIYRVESEAFRGR